MIAKERDQRPTSGSLDAAGEAAERQMAFYLARAFGPSTPTVHVFNDLRLPANVITGIDGDAVQIDHLVLHPHGMVIVESKSVTTRVRVNAHGEWARWWNGSWHGIPSPVQQAKRQAEGLRAILQAHRAGLRGRKAFGLLQGGFRHCPIDAFVAFSNAAVVECERGAARPPGVFKADAVADGIMRVIERERSAASLVSVMLGKDDKAGAQLPAPARRDASDHRVPAGAASPR